MPLGPLTPEAERLLARKSSRDLRREGAVAPPTPETDDEEEKPAPPVVAPAPEEPPLPFPAVSTARVSSAPSGPGTPAGRVVAYAQRKIGARWPSVVYTDREENARKGLPPGWEVVRVTVEPVKTQH